MNTKTLLLIGMSLALQVRAQTTTLRTGPQVFAAKCEECHNGSGYVDPTTHAKAPTFDVNHLTLDRVQAAIHMINAGPSDLYQMPPSYSDTLGAQDKKILLDFLEAAAQRLTSDAVAVPADPSDD